MRLGVRSWQVAVVGLAGLLAPASPAHAQLLSKELPPDARGLDVEEKPGAPLPLDTQFTNSQGITEMLGRYFTPPSESNPAGLGGKPAVLVLAYYRCPVVCAAVLDKLTDSFNGMDYTPGREFNCLVISFDERDTTKDAAEKRELIYAGYDRPISADIRNGWQFFTGSPTSVRQVAEAVGFRYRQLENGEYSHPICLFVITPEGKVSRYFYGFEYPSRDMKLALIEASEGRIARSLGDRLLAFCYMYDPSRGAYTLQAMRVMQIGGALSAAGVFGVVGVLLVRERLRRRKRPAAPAPPARAALSGGLAG